MVLVAIIWDLLLKSVAKSTTSFFRITVYQLQTTRVKYTVDVTQKMETISLQLVRVIVLNKVVSFFVLIKRKRLRGRLVYGNKSLIFNYWKVLWYIDLISDHVLRILDSSTPGYQRINRIQAKDVGYVFLYLTLLR